MLFPPKTGLAGFCQKLHLAICWREIQILKQEMELFVLAIPKYFSEKGSGFIKTGNGIIYPNSSHWINKLLSQMSLFQKQELDLSKQEIQLVIPLPVIGSNNFFNKSFPIWIQTIGSKQEM